jgi:hypothetical protein
MDSWGKFSKLSSKKSTLVYSTMIYVPPMLIIQLFKWFYTKKCGGNISLHPHSFQGVTIAPCPPAPTSLFFMIHIRTPRLNTWRVDIFFSDITYFKNFAKDHFICLCSSFLLFFFLFCVFILMFCVFIPLHYSTKNMIKLFVCMG